MQVQGRVLEFRKDGKGIKLDSTGEMYSVFNQQMLNGINLGDTVSFDFKEGTSINKMTGRPYLNISGKVTNLSGSGQAPTPVANNNYPVSPSYVKTPDKVGEPVLATSRCILRQNALTAAVNFMNYAETTQITPEFVILVAKEFEAYTSGDADLEEVTKELGDEE